MFVVGMLHHLGGREVGGGRMEERKEKEERKRKVKEEKEKVSQLK